MIDWLSDLSAPERLLLVGVAASTVELVRRRYPGVETVATAGALEAIAECARGDVRGILLHVEPGGRRLRSAVSGLREIAGDKVPLLLHCDPAAEPIARQLLDAGADDYLIAPPEGGELDRALGLQPAGFRRAFDLAPAPAASFEELAHLGDILADLGAGSRRVLERLSHMLLSALGASGVSLTIHGQTASAGAAFDRPVLCEPVCLHGEVAGQIALGPRSKLAYGSGDGEKLRHYARLVGHLFEAAESRHHWQRLAWTDDLSGLYNRRYLRQALDKLLARAEKQRFRVTLLIFDIDDFKRYNDTCGHAAGDDIIREAGQLFQRHCRKHDIVTRYGGDEFAVVFWDAEQPRVAGSQHPPDVLDVLTRFRAALESHEFPSLGPEARGVLTISGGLASFPWNARTPDELIARADEALLTAKRHGKNRIYLIGRESPEPVDPCDRTDAEPRAPRRESP